MICEEPSEDVKRLIDLYRSNVQMDTINPECLFAMPTMNVAGVSLRTYSQILEFLRRCRDRMTEQSPYTPTAIQVPISVFERWCIHFSVWHVDELVVHLPVRVKDGLNTQTKPFLVTHYEKLDKVAIMFDSNPELMQLNNGIWEFKDPKSALALLWLDEGVG